MRRAARRQRHELAKAAMTSSTTGDHGSDLVLDHEQTLVIHEEIGRLPEKFRRTVVLCYLDGLTHEMAAEHLGWPVGSVKSRLAKARERLRSRLARRGLAPAAIPLVQSGTSTDEEPTPAHVLLGTPLLETTLRGVLSAASVRIRLLGSSRPKPSPFGRRRSRP